MPSNLTSSLHAATRLLAVVPLLAVAAFGCAAVANKTQGDAPTGSTKGTSRLAPDLQFAVNAAIRAAEQDGVRMVINSGWRSRSHQKRLFTDAVAKYGNEQEARRWVATPDTSAHVSGDAVDIGPPSAAAWLNRRGSAHGLCQTFENEPWHFELATDPGGRCPAMWPDGRRES